MVNRPIEGEGLGLMIASISELVYVQLRLGGSSDKDSTISTDLEVGKLATINTDSLDESV